MTRNRKQTPLLADKSSSESDELLINEISPDPNDLLTIPHNCAESVEKFCEATKESVTNFWKLIAHHELPEWMQDNEYLLGGHRPVIPSIKACIISWFRLHTETVNIWTHLVGAIMFIFIALYTFTRPYYEIDFQEKFIFGFFFMGAITCLFCSTFYHTFCCHSPKASTIFRKLDYCGISLLTMGSFVPWLYYAFYCDLTLKVVYLIFICSLGSLCIVVSLMDKFGSAEYRALRAGMFIALGLSAVIPVTHFGFNFGFYKAYNVGKISWLILMAVLYIAGACIYAARIPERFFPGYCDIWVIWFQSHQIFHVCVVAAAYVHYIGITEFSGYRLSTGDCLTAHVDADYSFDF